MFLTIAGDEAYPARANIAAGDIAARIKPKEL